MIKIFDVKKNCFIRQFQGHKRNVLSLQFSKDDSYLVSYSKDNTIKVWNMDTFDCVTTKKYDSPIYFFELDNMNRFLLLATDERVILWDLINSQCVKTFTGFGGKVNCAKFSPDSQYIVAASKKYVKIINVSKKRVIKTFVNTVNGKAVQYAISIDFFKNSRQAAIIYNDNSLGIIDLNNFTVAETIDTKIYSNIKKSKIKVGIGSWQMNSSYFSIFKNPDDLLSGTFDYTEFISPEDTYISTLSSNQKNILLFSTSDYALKEKINEFSHIVQFAKFSPDEKFLIASDVNSNNIVVWDIDNRCSYKLEPHSTNIVAACFFDCGKKIISMSKDDVIKIHNIKTFKCENTLQLIDGYNVLDVNLQNIHSDSVLSDDKKLTLKRYGAIID